MGGCRCTYRNCTVKTDGKTHMFHYPVFEKVRCHQWLVNAHRLEFLDLKVSQLKNRVVCQHHFKDENFMNFKKDKLTFDAIPTEDGPYCDPKNYVKVNPDSSKLFSIIIDDIENDYSDKKANFSLKYGDFLANLDLMDIEKIDEDTINHKNTYNTNVDILSPHKSRGKGGLFSDDNPFLFNISLPEKSEKKSGTHPILAVSPYTTNTNVNHEKNFLRPKSSGNIISTETNFTIGNPVETIKHNQHRELQTQKKEPKVKIISEKKVTNPMPITGKFEVVSPNFVLNVSKRRSKVENGYDNTFKSLNNKTANQDATKSRNQDTIIPIEIEISPEIKEEEGNLKPEEGNSKPEDGISLLNSSQSGDVQDKSPKVSITKTKVPPERVKAINKKREFNMKLRDMVETCLDKLDNCHKEKEKSQKSVNTEPKANKRKVETAKSLHKSTSTPNTQEYTIAFLEARLRKMENTLLEKIEQNTTKITELKNTFEKSEKQSAAQVKPDEEIHKKQLFQEIAKYLSPSSKSLIYEELFINKFSVSEPTAPPNRKRRRR